MVTYPLTYPLVVVGDEIFTKDNIKEATLVENFNLLSVTLPISEFDMTIYSTSTNMSIVNPSGPFEDLVSRQLIQVYEVVGTKQILLGHYFVDEWESITEYLMRFRCVDYIGLLDKSTYMGGIWLNPISVQELVSDILDESNVLFDVDPDVGAITLKGWIPICTRREALQQVLFAANAFVRAARDSKLVIGRATFTYPTDVFKSCGSFAAGQSEIRQRGFKRRTSYSISADSSTSVKGIRSGVANSGQSYVYQKRWRSTTWSQEIPSITIPASEQGINRSVSLLPEVSGVEITAHDIVEGDTTMKAVDDYLEEGTYEIKFSQPLHSLSISGASIQESGANYAIIDVISAGDVLLKGYVYLNIETVFSRHSLTSKTNKKNVVSVTDACLINKNNVLQVLDNLFNYYQQRYEQSIRLFNFSYGAGTPVTLESYTGRSLRGTIEQMEVDLSGGYLSDARVIGVLI